MKKIWIGYHRPITIGPIVKPGTHLISPICDVTRRQANVRALVFVYIIEVAHAHAQKAPLE